MGQSKDGIVIIIFENPGHQLMSATIVLMYVGHTQICTHHPIVEPNYAWFESTPLKHYICSKIALYDRSMVLSRDIVSCCTV